MMEQVLLGDGKNVMKHNPTKEEQRQYWQRDFYMEQIVELVNIRAGILNGTIAPIVENEEGSNWEEVHKFNRMLGSWWYCNHIAGWDNNIPSTDDFCFEYKGIPDNELMANSIRDCFLAVGKGCVSWNKDFAIRRLDRAIIDYEKSLSDINNIISTTSRPELPTLAEQDEGTTMDDMDDEDDMEDDEDMNEMTVTQHKTATKKAEENKAQPGLNRWF